MTAIDDAHDSQDDSYESELPAELQTAAARAALDARSDAYAPYSGFDAGAAVIADDGTITTGALVENISLGLSMCAERVALFNAVTSGRRPVALVLAAPNTGRMTTWPCGACRQVALELGGPDMRMTSVGRAGGDIENLTWRRIGDLLVDAPHRQSPR